MATYASGLIFKLVHPCKKSCVHRVISSCLGRSQSQPSCRECFSKSSVSLGQYLSLVSHYNTRDLHCASSDYPRMYECSPVETRRWLGANFVDELGYGTGVGVNQCSIVCIDGFLPMSFQTALVKMLATSASDASHRVSKRLGSALLP